jgi:serine phosphatase RsbU (regulator of sigma subunit)
LSYSNAGHNPPLLINVNRETRFIEYGEQPLGMFPETRVPPASLKAPTRRCVGSLYGWGNGGAES